MSKMHQCTARARRFSPFGPLRRWSTGGLVAGGLAVGLLPVGAATAQPECSLTPSLEAHAVPEDVCVAAAQDPLPFFNALAWQTFKMLVWPAAKEAARRGEPDTTRPINDMEGLRTFETFKPQWELFRPNAAAPEAWGSYPATAAPCQGNPAIRPDDLVLGSFDEFGVIRERSPQQGRNALVARNKTFVRYLAAYNRFVFETVVAAKLYDPSVVAPFATVGEATPDTAKMPEQAITVKSAWVELPPNATSPGYIDPTRFHVRNAWVQDPDNEPGNSPCRQVTVGLVALHIVHKTKSRPHWVWATFEHVDNAPRAGDTVTQPYTFHDATATTPSVGDEPPTEWRFPNPLPLPRNVTRRQVIESTTVQANQAWQTALRAERSVWANYMLVMTQWPHSSFAGFDALEAVPVPPCRVGTPNTALANLVLETFFQTPVECLTRNGSRDVAPITCMTCHNRARITDFIWSIRLNGKDEVAGGTPTPGNDALRMLLESLGRAGKQ